jgi:hypothetical protein
MWIYGGEKRIITCMERRHTLKIIGKNEIGQAKHYAAETKTAAKRFADERFVSLGWDKGISFSPAEVAAIISQMGDSLTQDHGIFSRDYQIAFWRELAANLEYGTSWEEHIGVVNS